MVQILFEDGGREHELDVQIDDPSATVGDLAQALDARRAHHQPLWVDDQRAQPDLELRDAGLHVGATVRFGDQAPAGPPSYAPRELVVTNGLDAGQRVPLEVGQVIIGRDPQCHLVLNDASVSRQHAVLQTMPDGSTTLQDLGSNNGTVLGWDRVVAPVLVADEVPITIGAAQLVVRPVRNADRPAAVDPLRYTTPAGTIPFNRPPRPAPPPPFDEIYLPKPPRPPSPGRATFSLITILSPIAMGAAMYLIIGSKLFLMFALLSPVLAVGRSIDNKRKGKQGARGEKERYRRELRETQVRLRDMAADECDRRAYGHPDPAEVARWAALPSVRLWERRPEHDDFLYLRVGAGTVPWEPPVHRQHQREAPPDDQVAVLEAESRLYHAPLPVDVSAGNVIGVVGDRSAAMALARSLLVQAAVLHGPADLPTMVLARPEAGRDWDWVKWLPHVRSAAGDQRMLSADPDVSARMADSYLAANQPKDGGGPGSRRRDERGPTLLVLVDDESLTEGRRAPVRNLLRGDAGLTTGIVVASSADRLPALCTSVVHLHGPGGDATLDQPQEGARVDRFVAAGLSERSARVSARALARFEDPELEVVGAGLPTSVRLLPLLGLEQCTPEAILARWKAEGPDPAPAGPIGMGEHGPFFLDFVTDGPHGLVGGTTGAGKSELLRSMVAGMAVSVDPDHLTFLLVDFKGGSAFDECAKLPHTVGMVTDLDEHLAERALRCLEAELKYRERVLRQAGASDLPDYLRNHRGTEPLPRLLVIIDEFATLKSELPDFIDALVGVAQRGRSLGVHMLLATQRPQGAISDNIKANTNLRIALRVQDRSDSNDVIGVGDAVDIPRAVPGRAYVRLGPGEVVPIQSALSTGERSEDSRAPVELAPFVYGPVPRQPAPQLTMLPPSPSPASPTLTPVGAEPNDQPAPTKEPGTETDLAVLVQAIGEAFTTTGRPEPRRPWPEPLPLELDLDPLIDEALAAAGADTAAVALDFVPVALADDPDAQSQYPVGWRPADGNLLVYGLGGSGTTTALSSLALSLARLHPPERLHLYVVDFGAGELAPLAGLPHCGGFVQSHERERQLRVVRVLTDELDRRRLLAPADRDGLPMIVTMIDGWPALTAEYKDLGGPDVVDTITRLCADGPEVGLYLMLTSERGAGITTKIVSTTRQRWAFRMAETSDYAMVGVRSRAVPEMHPGHALFSESRQLVHLARPREGLAAAVQRRAPAGVAAVGASVAGAVGTADEPHELPGPQPILSLPTELPFAELGVVAQLRERPWHVPVGLAEADRRAAALVAYEGEHVMVAGPVRSGKSTTLLTVADSVLAAEPEALVAAVATGRSPLLTDHRIKRVVDPSPETIGQLQEVLEASAPVVLVLVDDAETIDEKRLEPLGTSRRPNLLVVAAGRADLLRSDFKHWSRNLRRSKLGVALQPEVTDAEMFGCRFPRRPPVAMGPGRGYVVNSGAPTLVQVALPTPAAAVT